MNVKHELEDAKKRQQEVVAQINAIKQQEQALLQEALRIDGELRLLQRMIQEESKDESNRDKSKD